MELILEQNRIKGRFKKGHIPFNKGLDWNKINMPKKSRNKIIKTLEKYRYLAHKNYPKYRYKVIMFDKENKVIGVFLDSVDAEKKTGICSRNIRNCCTGNRKSAGGYIWKREKDLK